MSDNVYATVFELSSDPIVIVSKAGFVLDANLSVLSLLGYSHNELIGTKIIDVIPLWTPEISGNNECISKTGRHIDVDIRSFVCPKTDTIIIEMRQKDLEKWAWTERYELFNSLEHELRTPLAAIEILASNIATGIYCSNPGHCQTHIGPSLTKHARYVKQVLNQMLIIGRDKACPDTEETQHTDIKKFLSEFYTGPVLPNIDKGGIELEIDIPKQDIWVQMSVTDLTTVINNLIVNAAEAVRGQECQKILVTTKQEAGSIIISVRDWGPGIPDTIGKAIFQKGVTTKKGTSDRKRGLGLATTLSIVSQWNGELWYENNDDDCGVTFYVRLPILRPSRQKSLGGCS